MSIHTISMDRWLGRVALVTGASSGIGAAIADDLVKRGMKVVGCARNISKIQELSKALEGSKGSLTAIKCDLRNEEEILNLFDAIKTEFGGVDVLINNAGLNIENTLLDGDTSAWRQILEVNILALAICSRESYKSMKERNVDDGHIIHISSMSGHRIAPEDPMGHFYCVSKHAVRAHLEGLRNELRQKGSHIRTTEISPGNVETQFVLRMSGPEADEKFRNNYRIMDAQDISDALIYVLSAPPHVQVHDILIRPVEQPF